VTTDEPKPRIGSSFDDFLREEGVLEETQARAIERVKAWQDEQTPTDDAAGPTAITQNPEE
jgi:hypothetical protein